MNPNLHSIHIHIHFYSQYSINYIPYLKPRKVHSLTMVKVATLGVKSSMVAFCFDPSGDLNELQVACHIWPHLLRHGRQWRWEGMACSTHWGIFFVEQKNWEQVSYTKKCPKPVGEQSTSKAWVFFGATHCSDMTELTDCKSVMGDRF